MGVTSVSLPKWKGKDIMSDSQIGSYDKEWIKTKKITEYSENSTKSYKSLRKIVLVNIDVEGERGKYTWLGTLDFTHTSSIWIVNKEGVIDWYYTNNVFGIRPVIEY